MISQSLMAILFLTQQSVIAGGVTVGNVPGIPRCSTIYNADVKSGTFEHVAGHGRPADTDEECMKRCDQEPQCTAWVRQPSTGRCWLTKQRAMDIEPENDRNFGLRCKDDFDRRRATFCMPRRSPCNYDRECCGAHNGSAKCLQDPSDPSPFPTSGRCTTVTTGTTGTCKPYRTPCQNNQECCGSNKCVQDASDPSHLWGRCKPWSGTTGTTGTTGSCKPYREPCQNNQECCGSNKCVQDASDPSHLWGRCKPWSGSSSTGNWGTWSSWSSWGQPTGGNGRRRVHDDALINDEPMSSDEPMPVEGGDVITVNGGINDNEDVKIGGSRRLSDPCSPCLSDDASPCDMDAASMNSDSPCTPSTHPLSQPSSQPNGGDVITVNGGINGNEDVKIGGSRRLSDPCSPCVSDDASPCDAASMNSDSPCNPSTEPLSQPSSQPNGGDVITINGGINDNGDVKIGGSRRLSEPCDEPTPTPPPTKRPVVGCGKSGCGKVVGCGKSGCGKAPSPPPTKRPGAGCGSSKVGGCGPSKQPSSRPNVAGCGKSGCGKVAGCGKSGCGKVCRPSTCKKYCRYGFATNRKGCQVCRCRSRPAPRGDVITVNGGINNNKDVTIGGRRRAMCWATGTQGCISNHQCCSGYCLYASEFPSSSSGTCVEYGNTSTSTTGSSEPVVTTGWSSEPVVTTGWSTGPQSGGGRRLDEPKFLTPKFLQPRQ